MRRAGFASLALLAIALTLAACGRERLEVPEASTPAPPRGVQPASYPAEGVRFQAPGGWSLVRGKAPLLAVASSGTAVVALWRYPRGETLPREGTALRDATNRLREAIQTRDPSFTVAGTRNVKVDGAPAVEVTGTATIARLRRRVRSTHVYAKGHELVIDAYAAPDDFDAVDRSAFGPVVRSLKIDPPS